MNTVEIVRISVLADNYVWLLHDAASEETVVVDPAVAEPILAEAERREWRISQIWNTHWHADHTGGNAAIKAETDCLVVGPVVEQEKIGTLDRTVDEGDLVSIGGIEATVIAVPGHTNGHIAYHLPSQSAVFVGDTLFAMGCGRIFEGTAEQMYRNMQRLSVLPEQTRVYCAHEYTQTNGRFALITEPDNENLVRRMADVNAARDRGEPTIPTTIAIERQTNPFFKARDVREFAERRQARDGFKG